MLAGHATWFFLATASAGVPPRPVHRVDIELRGPVAIVEVERSLEHAGEAGQERVLDLDLPDGAVLIGVEARVATGPDAGRVRLGPAVLSTARAAYVARLATERIAAARHEPDPGTDVRVRVASGAEARLRYRFVAPLACEGGRFLLRVPGSLEAAPAAAEVRLRFGGRDPRDPAPDLRVAGMPCARGKDHCGPIRAPARAAWEAGFAAKARGFPAQVLAAAARVPRRKAVSGELLALGACRPEDTPGGADPLPGRVLLAIDRSRSVGPAGIGAEGELARALVAALPPSVRFNAVLFDREIATLFPLPREATSEALAAIAHETTPGGLRNGTDLGRALEALADQERRDPVTSPVSWWAVITDGALPEGASFPGSATAARPVALLVLRSRGDEPPSPTALRALRALPSRTGGILRVVDPAEATAAVAEALATLRRGGDLFDVAVSDLSLDRGLAPGQGLVRVLPAPRHTGATLTAVGRLGGRSLRTRVQATRMAGGPLGALLRPPVAAWGGSSLRLAAIAESGPPSTVPDLHPRGEMDRTVLRNALSLSFLPRARACYLDRRVRGGSDLELRGRVRLELHIERGEIHDAVVRQSTLARPDIEDCLREAAFAVEVPRPLGRDAPAVAALNLVFQPRSPPPTDRADGGALSREIDLLIEPLLVEPSASSK